MNPYTKELEVATAIAREAGEIMLKYFEGDQQIEIKKDNSHVTIADKLINSLVIERLSKAFPEDGVIGEEESTATYGMGRKWICDPIDGTAAYVWGVTTAMFSLALIVDGKPSVGITFDPFQNKLFTGIIGGKALCNEKEISVSKKDFSTNGIVGVSGSVRLILKAKHVQNLLAKNVRLACLSGAVYKYMLVVQGRLIGYIEEGVQPHDIAASYVIATCAGARITSPTGGELDFSKSFKGAIVSNGLVHQELIDSCK